MLYVIDSSEPNEKLEKLKGWLEFHIDEAFKAAEVTESDTIQCEFLLVREKNIYHLNFLVPMLNNICQFLKQ